MSIATLQLSPLPGEKEGKGRQEGSEIPALLHYSYQSAGRGRPWLLTLPCECGVGRGDFFSFNSSDLEWTCSWELEFGMHAVRQQGGM